MARNAILLVLLPLTACAGARWVQGPSVNTESQIVKIVIEALDQSNAEPVAITDQDTIGMAVRLFAGDGWQENNDNPLISDYRVQMFASSGSRFTYWMGTFSNPPRFPCYWFCSGWWVASSGPDGELLRTIYKPLATSGQMLAVGRLLSNRAPTPQPNTRVEPPGLNVVPSSERDGAGGSRAGRYAAEEGIRPEFSLLPSPRSSSSRAQRQRIQVLEARST